LVGSTIYFVFYFVVAVSFPRPLRERTVPEGKRSERVAGSEMLFVVFLFVVVVVVVVIASGRLVARGNPETDKAFVFVVSFPRPLRERAG
jgi:hypothetical protein